MRKKETFWSVEFGFYPGILMGVRTYNNNPFESIHVFYIPFVDIAVRYMNDVEGYRRFVEAAEGAIEEVENE